MALERLRTDFIVEAGNLIGTLERKHYIAALRCLRDICDKIKPFLQEIEEKLESDSEGFKMLKKDLHCLIK